MTKHESLSGKRKKLFEEMKFPIDAEGELTLLEMTFAWIEKQDKEAIKELKEEEKEFEEDLNFENYDLKGDKRSDEFISGFRRALLLVSNSWDIHKYHKDKIFGKELV